MDAQHLINLPPLITKQRYTHRDTILYALGVGAGSNADERDLHYLYEEKLAALPSMAVVLTYPGFWQKKPQYNIDWKRVLHAEQSVLFHRPIPVAGHLRGEMSIDAIVDKGAEKGALLRAVRKIYNNDNDELIATVRQISFLRGDGGCGDAGENLDAPKAMPETEPEQTITIELPENLAMIYRLSGDYNPLHIDPQVAKDAGLLKPILHGLSTYGVACRAVLRAFLDDKVRGLSRLDCRFTAPVFPGDTLEVDLWRTSPTQGAFRIRVPSRDAVAINFGRADFN